MTPQEKAEKKAARLQYKQLKQHFLEGYEEDLQKRRLVCTRTFEAHVHPPLRSTVPNSRALAWL